VTTPSEFGHHKAAADLDPPVAGQPVGDGNEQPAATGTASSLYAAKDTASTAATRLPPRRPPELWAGAAFLTLAALPVAILGAVLAAQFGQTGANLRQKISESGTSIDVDSLLTGLRVVGVALLVLGVAFGALAWLALQPKREARRAATVLVAVEVVLLVSAMVVAAPDPVSIGVLLLAIAGTVLFYLPRSEEFLSFRR
jgi:hypothetical protein